MAQKRCRPLPTNYTVSGAGTDSGGNVTFVTAPGSTDTVVIQRKLDLTQGTDYVANDPFPAESHEDALDRLTFITQQIQEEVDRSIKASVTNTLTGAEFTVSATDRANKVFAFDSNGDLSIAQELGTFRGNWAASTAYSVRDLVKDTSTNNIFIVNTAHTSSGAQPLTTNANSAKYDLIVDAASATTSATNAATSATNAGTSETNAAASAASALSHKDDAETAKTAAETAQTAAESAQTAAETAKTAAETALDTFDDRFLGAKSSDPTVDNDGNALIDGALYFDTTNDLMKVYDLTNTQWRQLALTGSNQTNVNTVAGQISPTNNISTLAAISGDITTVAGMSSSDITAVAGKATEVGRLGTADAVADMAILGTADVVADMNTLGTAAIVADMDALADVASNITTVANNITDVNNFADTYFVSATAPASPTVGDLWFDTTNDIMKVYSSGGFINAGSSINGTSNRETYTVGTNEGSYTGSTTVFPITYDAGFIDVYLNGIKLDPDNDFTATNGTSVTLSSAAATGDIVDMVGFGTFTLSNFSIGDANNVDLTGLANDQFLQYNSTTSNFEPATIATDVSGDSTPQLGGNLDLNSNDITGTGNISTTGNATFTGTITVGDGHTIGDDGNDNLTLTSGTSENIKYDAAGGNHLFLSNGTEKARLSSDGRLAIGHTTPLDPLSVKVHGNRVLSVRRSTDAALGVGLSSRNDDATGNLRDISLEGEEIHLSTGSSAGTTATARLKIDATGTALLKAEGSDNLRTNLGQGSAKQWISLEIIGANGVRDSYNNTSISDVRTGLVQIVIANNMNNSQFAVSSSTEGSFENTNGSNGRTGDASIQKTEPLTHPLMSLITKTAMILSMILIAQVV